jgi:hypothetical protein
MYEKIPVGKNTLQIVEKKIQFLAPGRLKRISFVMTCIIYGPLKGTQMAKSSLY